MASDTTRRIYDGIHVLCVSFIFILCCLKLAMMEEPSFYVSVPAGSTVMVNLTDGSSVMTQPPTGPSALMDDD